MANEFQRQVQNLVNAVRGNRTCVECDRPNPTWTSTNLGVFLCLDCSGIHRSLGTHISKVKSTTLDKWDASLVAAMEQIGNTRSREYWEASMPPTLQRPKNMQERAAFIRDKYVNKRYVPIEGQATATSKERIRRESLERKPDAVEKKKRIPPSQRRKLQQQHQKQTEKGLEEENVKAVRESVSPPSRPTEKASGLSGNLFSNLNIKCQAKSSAGRKSPCANNLGHMQAQLKYRNKSVGNSTNTYSIKSNPNEVDEEANLLEFNIQDSINLLSEGFDAGKQAVRFDDASMNANVAENDITTVQETIIPTSSLFTQSERSKNMAAINIASNYNAGDYHHNHSVAPPSQVHQLRKDVDTQHSGIYEKLSTFKKQLADAETIVLNAKEALITFVQARENVLASKLRLEALSGQVDDIQMRGLDALVLHDAEPEDNVEIEDMKSLRKHLNQKASNIAQILVDVHTQLTNELAIPKL